MKRIIGLLLALLTVFGLGMGTYAKLELQGVTFGESIPMYTVTQRTDPMWEYEQIEAHSNLKRLRPIYRQGELVGQVPVENRSSDWWYDREEGKLAAGHLVERYGNDLMILEYKEDRFVIFPDEPNTLYPLQQFEDKHLAEPVPYAYSLPEYVKAAVFLEWQPDIKEAPYSGYADAKIDGALAALANRYWVYYFEKQAVLSRNVGIGVTVGLILLFGGIAVFLVILGKKGKLKINLALTHRLWNYPPADQKDQLQGFIGR